MVLLCFVAPFLLLLSRDVKQNIRLLAFVALIVIAGYGVNMYWTIVPAFWPIELGDHLAAISGLIAVGGLWSALNAWQLARIVNSEEFRINHPITDWDEI
jgi:hypothetical protein